MLTKQDIFDRIEARSAALEEINATIWSTPELGFAECKSIKPLIATLEEAGFTTEMDVADIPTAFVSSWGKGAPVIGFLAEYDALPSLSQVAGATEQVELEPDANGHGCGHCGIGTGCMAAAIAYKEYLESNQLPGTVKFFGCPGEEAGAGKVFMAREGVFDGTDICLSWHPYDFNSVMSHSCLSNKRMYFKFKGVASHAAAAPHLGRSALDACELTNIGVNYLREHMLPDARIHYSYMNAGGKAPNTVQDKAELCYVVRCHKMAQTKELTARVHDIARGAALMSGTELTIVEAEGMCETIPVESLDHLLYDCMVQVGPPAYDENDYALAAKYRENWSDAQRCGNYLNMSKLMSVSSQAQAQELTKRGLADFIQPFNYIPDLVLSGSTDVGDVSYVVPTSTFFYGGWAIGTPAHCWEATAQSNSSIFTKATVAASKVLALAAIQLTENPALVETIQAEHKVLVPDGYDCPIPSHVTPGDVRPLGVM